MGAKYSVFYLRQGRQVLARAYILALSAVYSSCLHCYTIVLLKGTRDSWMEDGLKIYRPNRD